MPGSTWTGSCHVHGALEFIIHFLKRVASSGAPGEPGLSLLPLALWEGRQAWALFKAVIDPELDERLSIKDKYLEAIYYCSGSFVSIFFI